MNGDKLVTEANNGAVAGPLPRRIHLVGIGGIGLSAIARVLAACGHTVSGSDLRASPVTRHLDQLGIRTFVGHAAEHVRQAELVVVSSAIPEGNVEIRAAQEAGIPVIKRQQLLGAMMAGRRGIAVAGTHGKTTTTAMISVILERLGRSPTFIVGGIVNELGTNAQAGRGAHFVIEADEYDHMFHGLWPDIAVVTNIEMDHPDCYRDIDDMRRAFRVFLSHVPADGYVVACVDSPQVARLLAERELTTAPVVTYGMSPEAEYRVADVSVNGRGGSDFCVAQDGRAWGSFSAAVPGVHNALNATAALLVSQRVGLAPAQAGSVLAEFRGVRRRFDILGECGDVVVIDDYAHHPTEVRATLAAARATFPGRRLWAVWQPHTHSRLETLLAGFATCFGDADRVVVTDVYAARAKEQPTIPFVDMVGAIQHGAVSYGGDISGVVQHLLRRLQAGDVVVTLGAGDSDLIGQHLLGQLPRER